MNRTTARRVLRQLAVGDVAHPGETLADHLLGTFDELHRLGVEESICAAGLCHALYGTDGFSNGPLRLAGRPRLRASIGPAAEHLAFLYAITDQHAFVAEACERLRHRCVRVTPVVRPAGRALPSDFGVVA